MITRAQIIACARTWLGTPFRHQGRRKGSGIDCVGLPLMVMAELGLIDLREEYANYSSQPVGTLVLDECRRRLIEKPLAEMSPGDVVCLRAPTVPCHVGIVTYLNGGLGLIHAYAGGARCVVEHILDGKWRRRIAAVFNVPGVTD